MLLLTLLAAGLGSLHFTVSGPPDCQRHARQGLLLLHSFVYEDARAEFRKAEAAAPCPVAYWGEAMTYEHPLWNEEDPDGGRAALSRLPQLSAMTPLEVGLIAAAKALFYSPGGWQARHEAWLNILQQLHEKLPNDDEAALFHALALYVCSEHGKDDARAMQAADIAEKVFERNPDHPGAAHYLIHACDSPRHAARALSAARKYAQIAPAAPHALHMPSHIFVQLGMWHDVESSNVAAFAASQKIGRPDWHSFRWLADARIELGKPQMVLPMLQQLHPGDSLEQRWVYALMLQMYFSASGAEGAQWDETLFAKLHEPPLPVEDEPGFREQGGLSHAPYGLYALQVEVETRLEHAAATGNEVAARKLASDDQALAARIKHGAVKLLDEARIAQARSVRDPSALDEAIAKTWALADFEDAQPVSGPADSTPARERLGDLLLRAHRSADAARAFQRALAQRPNRLHALRGLSAAALAAGQPEVAAKARAQIAVQEQ